MLTGISEIGHIQSDHTVYYSGLEKQRRRNVVFIVRNDITRIVLGYNATND